MAFRHLNLPNKRELRDLYVAAKLSTYQIAERYDCDPKTVYQYLKSYHIPTRARKRVYITEKKLRFLYTKQRFTLATISKLYSCCPVAILSNMKRYGIPRRSTSETNIKYPRKSFSRNFEEKAYLLGFRIGDLGVRKVGNFIKVGCGTTQTDQIKLIESLFDKYGPGWTSKRDVKGRVHIDYSLDDSFQFLLLKHRNIPEWVIANQKFFLEFFAGYTDAEGTVGIYSGRARFRIGSYDYGILRDIHRKLTQFHIKNLFALERKSGIDKRGILQNGNFWRITVNKMSSLKILFALLGPHLRHGKRIRDLRKAKRNIDIRIKKFA
ncbi:MAG: hypothetical protein A2843_02760 [Candidatus Wildermuthbacteria bacterium RIFCSPHIGHO2_01_FULL_48_27b]|uniref:DOD-type homing endonuclease domain-containing protein n=1 Tax=Candidatus Wildermuthbacteria bacterium RIFCSPHIGHO2_01_FULL_48_27b TaxID=1802447 RepID=A0A1G2QUM5_9BACT|nr:MAG: hypothetical protein A2843_02760 [Candidatus Wildermuthbacteria bacterium RIFCSPHIGHO2_01_FULL_48_27b]